MTFDLTELQHEEKQIGASEESGLWARWRSGQILLSMRQGKKQLPKGLAEQCQSELGIARWELTKRMKFAELYPTETQVSDAVIKFSSWRKLTHEGLNNPNAKPRDTKSAELREDGSEDWHCVVGGMKEFISTQRKDTRAMFTVKNVNWLTDQHCAEVDDKLAALEAEVKNARAKIRSKLDKADPVPGPVKPDDAGWSLIMPSLPKLFSILANGAPDKTRVRHELLAMIDTAFDAKAKPVKRTKPGDVMDAFTEMQEASPRVVTAALTQVDLDFFNVLMKSIGEAAVKRGAI